jgi:hypothetical protein
MLLSQASTEMTMGFNFHKEGEGHDPKNAHLSHEPLLRQKSMAELTIMTIKFHQVARPRMLLGAMT